MKHASTPVRKATQEVGYVRVSSSSQNTVRQLVDIDVEMDRVFTESVSAKDTNRPELQRCLAYLREGDKLHVHSLDRLGRSVKDLCDILKDLRESGVAVHFHKENLLFEPGESDPMSNLMFHIFGAVAEFERALIRDRQREGIDAAIARNVYKGRSNALDAEAVKKVREMVAMGEKKAAVARTFNVSRNVIYRVIKYVHPYSS